MVKSFRGHTRAEEDFSELYENSLFTTPQERAALVADKPRVAHAFLLNFFGLLGMINATKPAQKKALLTFLKTDKKLRIDTIDDTNLDISLSLKLANDAGFFTQSTTVAEITRFLVKLKTGQIDHIDSAVVGKWAAGMKPDFLVYIRDAAARRIFNQFRMDGGKTIDVSNIAVVLKSRVNKMSDGGDFQRFAKRFIGLTVISPSATTPVAVIPTAQPAAAPAPTAPVKLSYYQRQKLKKQQAAAGTTTTPAAAPAKLSYYQKQKLKKLDAAKAAQAAADQAAAAQAAADADAARLAAKEKEENQKAAAAAIKTMPSEHFDKMVDSMVSSGYSLSGDALEPRYLKYMFKFDVIPDVYLKTSSRLINAAQILQSIIDATNANRILAIDELIRLFNKVSTEIEKISGHSLTISSFLAKHSSRLQSSLIAALAYAVIRDNQPVDDAFYSKIFDSRNFPFNRFLNLFDDASLDKLAKVVASNEEYYNKMLESNYPLYTTFMSVSMSYGSSAPFNYSQADNMAVNSFSVKIMKAGRKSFEDIINHFMKSSPRSLVSFFQAYGFDPAADVTNIYPDDIKYLKQYVKYFLENEFDDRYQDLKRTLLNTMPYNKSYNASYPLLKALHDEFASDVISVGYSKSKLQKLLLGDISDSSVKRAFSAIGIRAEDLMRAHPNDPASIYMAAIQNGLNSITPKRLAAALLTLPGMVGAERGADARVANIWQAAHNMLYGAQGDRDQNCNSVAQAMLEIAYTRPDDFKMQRTGESLMAYLPYANQDTVIKWLKLAKESNNKWIMGSDLYKQTHKTKKQTYVDVLTGILQDSIGTEVEDFVNDIMEQLAPHVIQKMRGNLVGGNAVIGELNRGEIKTFDKIDAARLKKIFLYNDLNMGSIISGQVEKKKKTETYAQYFARASKTIQSTSLLGEAKVKADPKADAKAINKIMIQRDHAGKHGDTYPKIDKVYDANLEYPEFWEFRKKKPRDGSIVPAYHGTGGIAATMILRYGFKVIKSSDPSVVGRMLGDGIYFSNKIDKVSQYVSNGGYSRQHGQKGYVMEMDTNLGTERIDYRAAGVKGNDSIRSPEWCVVDPKAQLRITKVYEVTLVSKSTVDRYLNEGVQYTGLKGFKQHLKEQVVENIGNVTSFVFRDGMIPIVNAETYTVTYVDFEEALSKNLIKPDMFDTSAQGPVIVFRNTDNQVVVDERYAEHMGGDELQLYIELFTRKMAAM